MVKTIWFPYQQTPPLTLVKLYRCMKCLATSLAASPNIHAAMSCQGMRGVSLRSYMSNTHTNNDI